MSQRAISLHPSLNFPCFNNLFSEKGSYPGFATIIPKWRYSRFHPSTMYVFFFPSMSLPRSKLKKMSVKGHSTARSRNSNGKFTFYIKSQKIESVKPLKFQSKNELWWTRSHFHICFNHNTVETFLKKFPIPKTNFTKVRTNMNTRYTQSN